MTKYALILLAGLSLVATGCSRTEAQDQPAATTTNASGTVQEAHAAPAGIALTQGFDDGSTITRDSRTGAVSSTPWTREGMPSLN